MTMELPAVIDPETTSLSVPGGGTTEDQIEFSVLPLREQESVRAWDSACREAHAAGHGTRGRVMAALASRMGCSAALVRQKYDRWLADGWRGLVNQTKTRRSTLPQAFVQFWVSMVEGHQRKTGKAQAWKQLGLRLLAWERDGGHPASQYAIPGYQTAPRRLRCNGLPAGWHYATLVKIANRHAETVARQQGPKAFSMTMPSVRASREGCEVGQFIFFDDERLDVLVNFVGNNSAMRPLAFHALDFVSGCNIGRGFKPVIQEGYSRRTVAGGLTKTDFDWFLLSILTQHGWNDRTGTTLIGEMGTACASDWLLDALPRVFGGKLQWDHSGRMGEPLRGMVYEGQSSGNFRFKAPLESWFNLWRNSMSALPGNVGRNRDAAPEENHGLIRESAWFLRQLETLPLERRLLLRDPVMPWHAFVNVANQMVEWINRRTDHTLGQWEKLGFVRLAMLDQMDPVLLEKLSAVPGALEAMAAAAPAMRRLSPREVWDMHSPRLRRLGGWQVTQLMPPDAAREVTVTRQRTIVITDREIDTEPLEYLATHCVNGQGHHLQLRPGDTFLAYLNPYAPHEIQICEALAARRGAWLGTCAANLRHSRAEHDELLRQYGRIQGAMAPTLADIAARAASTARSRQEDRAINRRVADTRTPLTPAETADADAASRLRDTFSGPDGTAIPEPAGIDHRALFGAE